MAFDRAGHAREAAVAGRRAGRARPADPGGGGRRPHGGERRGLRAALQPVERPGRPASGLLEAHGRDRLQGGRRAARRFGGDRSLPHRPVVLLPGPRQRRRLPAADAGGRRAAVDRPGRVRRTRRPRPDRRRGAVRRREDPQELASGRASGGAGRHPAGAGGDRRQLPRAGDPRTQALPGPVEPDRQGLHRPGGVRPQAAGGRPAARRGRLPGLLPRPARRPVDDHRAARARRRRRVRRRAGRRRGQVALSQPRDGPGGRDPPRARRGDPGGRRDPLAPPARRRRSR